MEKNCLLHSCTFTIVRNEREFHLCLMWNLIKTKMQSRFPLIWVCHVIHQKPSVYKLIISLIISSTSSQHPLLLSIQSHSQSLQHACLLFKQSRLQKWMLWSMLWPMLWSMLWLWLWLWLWFMLQFWLWMWFMLRLVLRPMLWSMLCSMLCTQENYRYQDSLLPTGCQSCQEDSLLQNMSTSVLLLISTPSAIPSFL